MRFQDLLSRADDETLQNLLGAGPQKILFSLDPSFATPQKLRQLIVGIHSVEGLLLLREKRGLLFDILPQDEAINLHMVLGLSDKNNVYDALKAMRVHRNSEREKALFQFFGLTPPIHEVYEPSPSTQGSQSAYPLFAHQRRAVQDIQHALSKQPHRVILHMPTGAGKTRTTMNIIAEHLRQNEPTLVIWLANTEELCEQSATEFEKAWGHLGNREVNVYRFWGDREIDTEEAMDGILVAGLAKMYSATRRSLEFILSLAHKTSLVVIDEAHSAIAETYSLILDALVKMPRPNPSLLGLTATPGRTWADIEIDQQLADFFGRKKVTLRIEGYDSPVDYLVDEQYLAKVNYVPLLYEGQFQLSEADIERIEKDLDIPRYILEKLAEDEVRNLAIIAKIEELATRHHRILVFATTVQHSEVLAAVLNMRGYKANSVTGNTPSQRRAHIIEQFKNDTDDVQILCNYGVLTTGFDAPQTSAAIIARPTKSLVLYSQMVGRAIRGKRAGGNLEAEIVSVVDTELPGFGSVAEAFNNWEDIWE